VWPAFKGWGQKIFAGQFRARATTRPTRPGAHCPTGNGQPGGNRAAQSPAAPETGYRATGTPDGAHRAVAGAAAL